MSRVLMVMLLAATLQVTAATITNYLTDGSGNPVSVSVRARLLSPPYGITNRLVVQKPMTWSVGTNGILATNLASGLYRLEFGDYYGTLDVLVPDGTGTYSLAELATNLVSFTVTNYLPWVPGWLLYGEATNLTALGYSLAGTNWVETNGVARFQLASTVLSNALSVFQLANANLSNAVSVFQLASANLTNWAGLATNVFDGKYQLASGNLSNAASVFQLASGNGTNWSALLTNTFDGKYQLASAAQSNLTAQGAITLGSVDLTNLLTLRPIVATGTNASAAVCWNSNNQAIYVRWTNGVDTAAAVKP